MIFQIPIKTVSEANRRGHWAKHRIRESEQRYYGAMYSRQWRDKIPKPVRRIKLTRVRGKRGRRLDQGNLAMSMKHVQDGICDALGIKDGDESIEWVYAQRAGDEWCVEVEIN